MPLTNKDFDNWGVPRPATHPHGTPDDLKAAREPVRPQQWRQEGNKLIGEHEIGTVVHFLPTDVIYHGQDENGEHVFKKVGDESREYAKSKKVVE